MPSWVSVAVFLLALFQAAPPAADRASLSPQAFVGTWVGTQRWRVANPPPGASPDQPVSLTIDYVDGKLTGTLTPFMGGEDGAVFVDAHIVGDELQASAEFGNPRPPAGTASGGKAAIITEEEEGAPKIVPANRPRPRPGWKEATRVQFVFKSDRLDLKGTGDVVMNGVKWTSFSYELSKKRARY